MAHATKVRSDTSSGLLTSITPPVTPVPWMRAPSTSTADAERLSDPLAVDRAPAHRSFARGLALVAFVVASSVGLWITVFLGYKALRG